MSAFWWHLIANTKRYFFLGIQIYFLVASLKIKIILY